MRRWICLAVFLLPALAQEPVRYQLRFPNAVHHEAEIRATFSPVRQPVLEVLMSRSSPGRYALAEFAKNVYNFTATDGQGHALAVSQPSPYQWNVSGHKGTVVVEYTLFGDRADGTYAGIDSTHAHLNPPAALVWARGFEKVPVALRFEVPAGSGWKVATQMVERPDGVWTQPNMQRLMDSPIELSAYVSEEWRTGDRQFRLALHHRGTAEEAAAFARMCQAVVTEEEGVFGAFPVYDSGRYTFLLDFLPYVNGDGMEHRDSTGISETRDLRDAASQMIGTVAHEFFHSWNVKRIRPRSLEPFDFERANMSAELWFAEGFTSYYGPLALQRAGLTSLDRFTRDMGGAVNAVLTAPGREIFNVLDMSRHAPFVDAAVSVDPVNTANTFISYYTYGQALALGIDLSIRSRFPAKTLDDWMRQMWREHPDSDRPYTVEDLEHTLGEATTPEFARDIFRRHIYGKEPMDYRALLALAGFTLEAKETPPKVWIGASLALGDRGADILDATPRGAPIYAAGLDRGDRILEWDGHILKTEAELEALLERHQPGDKIHLRYISRGEHKEADLVLAASPAETMEPFELSGKEVTPAMAAFRQAWLGSKAIHPLPKLLKYCPQCKRPLAFEYEKCPYDGADLRITPKPAGEKPFDEEAPAPARRGRGGRGR
ncbi:MAG: M61 family metallopeptidase [Bryobacteraceae bacterium]|jgi:predicted metalloprotease with PDZ domain